MEGLFADIACDCPVFVGALSGDSLPSHTPSRCLASWQHHGDASTLLKDCLITPIRPTSISIKKQNKCLNA